MNPAPPPGFLTKVLDRRDIERAAPSLIDDLRQDPRTRVVLTSAGEISATSDGRLRSVADDEIPAHARWAFLGRDADGSAVLTAAIPRGDGAAQDARVPLRQLVGGLPRPDAGLALTAVALGRWLVEAPHCPACGALTDVVQSGWARTCPACGTDAFPRTDPAVIVAIASEDGARLLLGSNAGWDRRRFSCFAGFVEAGESLEDAVVREVQEECGVRATRLSYAGSQGWPFPRSLMVGFHAHATRDDEVRPDGVEILDARWFTRDQISEALAGHGDILLPGSASISRSLIEAWCAEPPA